MRRHFASLIHTRMALDPRLWVLVGDVGYGVWDRVRDDYPDRFVNVGAAESLLLDMAIGLALRGKIPLAYSITPFLLCRGFESIRTYINAERIGVKIIGSGRGREYAHDGWSHHASDDAAIIGLFPNVAHYRPETRKELEDTVDVMLSDPGPGFVSLSRGGISDG